LAPLIEKHLVHNASNVHKESTDLHIQHACKLLTLTNLVHNAVHVLKESTDLHLQHDYGNVPIIAITGQYTSEHTYKHCNLLVAY
jgi:hypothetical protein